MRARSRSVEANVRLFAGVLVSEAAGISLVSQRSEFAEDLEQARRGQTPVMALRRHDDGTMDDVVVENVTMFRAEQMDDDELWLCCYFSNGERVAFFVHAKCRPKRLVYDVTEMPPDWIDWDDRAAGVKPASNTNQLQADIDRAHGRTK